MKRSGFTPTLIFTQSTVTILKSSTRHIFLYLKESILKREQSSQREIWCRGFTLIEVLITVAIIAILAGIILANTGQGYAQSRDTERKADLRSMQTALELYKTKYGRYPAGCNTAGTWSGQAGTDYACNDGTGQYIKGDLSATPDVVENFSPQFIKVLPADSKLNGNDSGYVYTTNVEGSVYKLMALKSVESEAVTYDNKFKSCDWSTPAPSVCTNGSTGACSFCNPTTYTSCTEDDDTFKNSYAVWGGYGITDAETAGIVCKF